MSAVGDGNGDEILCRPLFGFGGQRL